MLCRSDVRADALGVQRWARCRRGERMPADQVLERVAAQPAAAHGREQRLIVVAAPFLEPLLQQLGGVAAKRCAALLAALAVASDVRTGAQNDVLAAQADQLGCAQPGLERDQQHRVIPAADPCRSVRCRKQRRDLFAHRGRSRPA